ncbi:MAG TPA: type II toxin-antitoxin system VapC family toxin [Candidatus Limnocylindria bacterium]|nr:type II toxin-antitoxin system VapC family toxin [Candidatus Limnocylindria bacterium]
MSARTYLDSSALVKLVIREGESAALQRFLRRRKGPCTCALARVEVVRAASAHGPEAVSRARQVIEGVEMLRLDDALLDAAGSLSQQRLRSLDAIHLAAAQRLGGDLAVLVSYDERMLAAARSLRIAVASPH